MGNKQSRPAEPDVIARLTAEAEAHPNTDWALSLNAVIYFLREGCPAEQTANVYGQASISPSEAFVELAERGNMVSIGKIDLATVPPHIRAMHEDGPAEPAGEEPKGWLYNGVWSDVRLPDFMRGEMTETPLYALPATPSNPDRLVEALRQADALFHHAFKLPADEQHLWLFSEEGCDAWQIVRAALGGWTHEISEEGKAVLSAAPALDGEKGE